MLIINSSLVGYYPETFAAIPLTNTFRIKGSLSEHLTLSFKYHLTQSLTATLLFFYSVRDKPATVFSLFVVCLLHGKQRKIEYKPLHIHCKKLELSKTGKSTPRGSRCSTTYLRFHCFSRTNYCISW